MRSHPDPTKGKVFDPSAEELAALKSLDDLVTLEIGSPDGITKEVVGTKNEFAKLVSADFLAAADSTRVRRSGYRPNRNGN